MSRHGARYNNSWDRFHTHTQQAEKRNPIILEKIQSLENDLRHKKSIYWQAFDKWSHEGLCRISEYTSKLQPAELIISKLYAMFYCTHPDKSVDNEGDYLYCRKCQAVNYGLGWDCPDQYADAILIIEKAPEVVHAPIVADFTTAVSQGHERGG